MIKFEIKSSRFFLMHRSVSKQLVPAKNWEGMRWIVCVAPDEMNSCNEVLESYVLNYPNSCFQELIVDREVKPYLVKPPRFPEPIRSRG